MPEDWVSSRSYELVSVTEWGVDRTPLSAKFVEETHSPYKAVTDCLDLRQTPDYFRVYADRGRRLESERFIPSLVWGNLEQFEERLRIFISAYKIQLGVDYSKDRATHTLIVTELEAIRMRRYSR